LLARWSGAPIAYGSEQPRENAASMFYTRNVLLPANGTHVVEQALRWPVRHGFIVPQPQAQAEFPVDPDAETKVASLINNNNNNDKNGFAILNPGAGWGAKMWPAERYAQVARELAKDGLCSLINHGPGEEPLAAAVEAQARCGAKCFLLDL